MLCDLEGLIEKLKDDGVVGWEVEGKPLELERGNGCEKVNCTGFVELLLVVNGLVCAVTERVEDGCEKLKSAGFDLAPGKEKKFLEVLELV